MPYVAPRHRKTHKHFLDPCLAVLNVSACEPCMTLCPFNAAAAAATVATTKRMTSAGRPSERMARWGKIAMGRSCDHWRYFANYRKICHWNTLALARHGLHFTYLDPCWYFNRIQEQLNMVCETTFLNYTTIHISSSVIFMHRHFVEFLGVASNS